MRRIALYIAGVVFVAVALFAALAWRYLLMEEKRGWMILTTGLPTGALAAGIAGFCVSRIRDTRRARWIVAAGLACLAILPMASMAWPGRIAFARFGLTVYGVIPIPAFDITIDKHGLIGFRKKTHLVTAAEIAPLLDANVERVIVGIGWDRLVRIDPAARDLAGDRLETLPTPEAFALYNRLRSEGSCVVLIAHSTC